MKKILLVLLTLSSSVQANVIGTFGPIYKIAEPDLYEWIVKERLPEMQRNGEIERIQTEMKHNAQKAIDAPRGITLPLADAYSRRELVLDNTVPNDIKNHKGETIIAKGTRVKYEDVLPESSKTLIFIDGDDDNQMCYAINEAKTNVFTKIVLVNGKLTELMREHDRYFYFDQQQFLINKFGIKRLPSKVHREKSSLIIEEVSIETAS